MKKVTIPEIVRKKRQGERLTMLTAYDATFARIVDDAGVDLILVGDSLGMVVQGLDNTLPVTLDDVVYHTRAVVRGRRQALVVADLPFMSYQLSPEQAMSSAGRLLAEGGAEAVKLEGGSIMAATVQRLVQVGIPVMGHIGLTPQSLHTLGGFVVQGKTDDDAQRLLDDARRLEDAGCFSLVLESIPAVVAEAISSSLSIPTIGIGAGAGCDGQVLVIYDLIGLNPEFKPRFVKRYAELGVAARDAAQAFVDEVKQGLFPQQEHSFASKKLTRVPVVDDDDGDDAEVLNLYSAPV
ncbi:MAG: 3-methyl-2-oxobutanoate hydroxymethyltransferase [Pseudomonadota bacterium]